MTDETKAVASAPKLHPTVAYQTGLDSDPSGYVASLPNILKALRSASVFEIYIRRDTFLDAILVRDGGQWRRFTDTDYVSLREKLQTLGFKEISRDKIADAVKKVAEENQFDSAQERLATLVWDGTPRVSRFLASHLGCKNSAYTRAVSEYLWTALAGRVIEPGIKADMALVLVGAQGTFKSSAVRAIAPTPDHFVEINLSDKDADLARMMRGKLVAEISELRGLSSRDADSIKSFISRQRDEWVPKFNEFAGFYDRRLVFLGTTNKPEFLSDDTGNRRWLPVTVIGRINIEAIVRDRDQLWAEAAMMFTLEPDLTHRVRWKDAQELAEAEHGQYFAHDEWEAPVTKWLSSPPPLHPNGRPRGDAPFTAFELLEGALGIKGAQVNRATQQRLGTILKQLGYERVRVRAGGQQIRVWAREGTVDEDEPSP